MIRRPARPHQRNDLTKLGIKLKGIYVDHGLTGKYKNGAGLREALAD